MPKQDATWWEELGAKSDRPEIREEIDLLIRRGEVRVRPRPGDPDRVDVIPRDPDTPAKHAGPGG
jgi:hypothetical protein